jgi:hypothetical protein
MSTATPGSCANRRPCCWGAIDPFDQPDWSYEPKWDGFRVLAAKISR